MIEPTRRKFIGSLIALVAAPAIVRAGSLMPVKVMTLDMAYEPFDWREGFIPLGPHRMLYEEMTAVTRKAFVPRLFVEVWNMTPLGSLLQEIENG